MTAAVPTNQFQIKTSAENWNRFFNFAGSLRMFKLNW